MSVLFTFLRIAVAFAAINIVCKQCSAVTKNTTLKIPTFTLNNGKEIPAIGYGTWLAGGEELEKAVEAALEAGYRHIDTAYIYENEKVIGTVLKRWITAGKLKREDIFLVTKLPPTGNRPDGVSKYLKKSLENLQVDYVDLYLIHTAFSLKEVGDNFVPMDPEGNIMLDNSTDHVATWKEMEKQMDAGLTKAIGISNFNKTQIKRILRNSRIKPSVLQIELHAYLQQNALVDLCKQNNVIVTAYSPLGAPGVAAFFGQFGQKIDLPDILGNPTVKKIAKKHSKTEAQVLLRFDIQRGIVPIPKSTNAGRLRQNLDVFDFELDQDDLKELKALNAGVRILDFGLFKGIKNHPEYPFRTKIKKRKPRFSRIVK